jgi:tripartite-type tricarboxylate transporter receptor subunit TctC
MKSMIRSFSLGMCLVAAAPVAWSQAAANYPNRPIKLIVPFGPGGFTDVVARVLGQRLGQAMGTSFVIENKPGAGSTIGTAEVAKAAPDGYTLVMISTTHTVSPAIYKNIPYDPIKSFTPVSKLVDSAYVLLAHPKVPANNVRELVALAKAQPDKINYASSGNGSTQHLMGGMFESLAGVQMKHVPYRSSAGAANDLVAGVVDISFAGVPNALAQVPAGRLKALAVTTPKRVPQLPDVPTMQEAGVQGYESSVWLALLAPANTPRDIVNRINAELAKVMAQPETRKALNDAGVEPSLSTPEALQTYMVQEMERWAKVVKAADIKAD